MKKLLFLMILFLFSIITEAQLVYNPPNTALRRDIYKDGNNSVQSSGVIVGATTTRYYVGKNNSIRKRALYQWNITENDIPTGSTINSVRIYFLYTAPGSGVVLQPKFFNVGIDLQNPDLNSIWNLTDPQTNNGIGSVDADVDWEYDHTYSGSSDPFVQAVQNSLTSNKFILGLAWRYESPDAGSIQWNIHFDIGFEVNYTPPNQSVTIDQILSDGTHVGSLRNWNLSNSTWDDSYSPPHPPFSFPINSTQTILGDQTIHSNQKYNRWIRNNSVEIDRVNHHSFVINSNDNNFTSRFDPTYPGVTIKNSLEGTEGTGGYIDFKDPWLIDYQDPDHGNQWQNRGFDNAQWYERSSPFYPDYYTNYDGFTYQGVFLNQSGPNTNWAPPYYNCWSGDQLIDVPDVGVRMCYFRNWAATGANLHFYDNEAWTEFTSSSAVVKAIFKGQGLSSDPHTFINNGQRKIVRTTDYNSTLHMVYQDMGHIWYETSTDNGQTWTIMNNAQPLDDGGGENPSIGWVSISGGPIYVVILYQQPTGEYNDYTIQAKVYAASQIQNNPTSFNYKQTLQIYNSGYRYTHEKADPVIAIYPGDNTAGVYICWHTTSGLNLQHAGLSIYPDNNPLTLIDSSISVPNTGTSSIRPSIAAANITYPVHIGIAWEENNTIRYNSYDGNTFTGEINLSDRDGYSGNANPSLVVLSDGYGRVCWNGSYCTYPEDTTIQTQNPICQSKVIAVNVQYPNNLFFYGNNTGSPNVNKSDDESFLAIAWSQDNGASTYFADDLSKIQEIAIPGNYIEVSNGNSKDQMYTEIMNQQSVPYFFKTSNDLGSYYSANKITSYAFSSGRKGVVYKDTAQFFFTVGDITVDNQPIDFVEIPDTLNIDTKGLMNQYLKTENFQLNDNSTFLYSVEYGITDSVAALNLFNNSNKQITFKLQLIDAQSSEVLGSYDEVTYDQSSLPMYNNYSYQVNTQGIGNRTVYLRLKVDDNFNPDYSLGQLYAIGSTLQKTNVKKREFNGGGTVTTYNLFQNYPNPFNPTTKITYQVPKPGNVELKVYDILGREVMTLVNDFRNVGKYTVDFKASKLASGVYFYRIKSGDFVSTKKMVLLK